ncbi:MAG: DJ-1/PfpI family protein [Oscillospiraceae bacterium]|jgi:4-methyl-5(b-hydroxyethyl)-thiazole monophosphate biosynthesis|nr:DJ-1/PfpI family protein [Oscillospiraceae bacterium]
MYYIFLADGFEDTEAIAPLDILRRANIPVQTVGVSGEYVTSARGVTVKADVVIGSIASADVDGVILPGGGGYKVLRADKGVQSAIDNAARDGKLVAAICAAPTILAERGLLNGKRATCFNAPDLRAILEKGGAIPEYGTDAVTDGNIITSRAAGTAVQFGVALVAYIKGKAIADDTYNKFNGV